MQITFNPHDPKDIEIVKKLLKPDTWKSTHSDAILSSDQVIEIRTSPLKGRELASKFGITESHVSRIRSGERYKGVK